MRKYQQNKLLEITSTINYAHREIIKALNNNQAKIALHILSECQESAVSIIDFIDEVAENKDLATIGLIESYYKMLYKISAQVDTSSKEIAKVSKLLNRQLIKIETSIKTELKVDRLEVLFLPYKASMWDSLESIWLAAKNDMQCDAFVVPIPYYDRLPNGSSGKMHYEGYMYPKYVPIVDWEEYSIEERRPDIIFIHNPYDASNYITQVHPDFFCERLQQFTSVLVYSPYFVCSNDILKEFCVLPGTVYANKVVVQSEKIREIYISEYRKFEDANNLRHKFGMAKEKFVALGSPKFDKVLNTKFENYLIPDEWNDLINNPDGSRKKVVLYNTSIKSLLDNKENMFLKLQYVFETFRGRNDVILLWRPHPLNITVYESILSENTEYYLQLVNEYKKGKWGIYDDSPDMSMAIALSDAYYGDWSSLIPIYQCTGKPVMIQNMAIHNNDISLSNPLFNNLCSDGENLWAASCNYNALFKINKHTWDIEYMGRFPNELSSKKILYRGSCYYMGKLYFAPLSAKEIAVYDIETGIFSEISFSLPKVESKVPYRPAFKFTSIVNYKHYLFFIPGSFPAFIRYNLNDGAIDYFYDWVQPLDNLVTIPSNISQNKRPYFMGYPTVNSSKFVVAACVTNAVVVFDMDDCVSKVYEIGNNTRRYLSICFDGEDYWMPPILDEPIISWNLETEKYKEYPLQHKLDSENSNFFSCYANGYVWLFSSQIDKVFKINTLDGSVTIVQEFQVDSKGDAEDKECLKNAYIQANKINDTIYAIARKNHKILEYNTTTGHCYNRCTTISKETVDKIHLSAFHRDFSLCEQLHECHFEENITAPLDIFLDYITNPKEEENIKKLHDIQIELFKNSISQSDGTSGLAIFSHCKQLIMSL